MHAMWLILFDAETLWQWHYSKLLRCIFFLHKRHYALSQGFINLDLYLYVGQLAVGCGDSIIRIWNTTNPLDPYNVVNIWQGIKAKVTTVCVKI